MAKKTNNRDLIPPQRPHPARSPTVRHESIQVTYQAPLPPPAMVEHFERIMPGAADRLFRMAEEQAEHRHGLENRKLDSDISNEKKGQYFAFVIALVAIIGSFALIWNGISTVGVTLFITTFAGLVSVFIVGRLRQESERRQKRRDMSQMLERAAGQPQIGDGQV